MKRCDADGNTLPEDNWVWAPTGIVNIHYPELWGFVFFTEGTETYEIPQDERDKWELRRLYYDVNCYYDENGHFPENLSSFMEEKIIQLIHLTQRHAIPLKSGVTVKTKNVSSLCKEMAEFMCTRRNDMMT